MSLSLCLLSFILCYTAGRRSLVSGLVAVLGVGYVYGIVRANVPQTYSHFIFDAGVMGLYGAQLFRPLTPAQNNRIQRLKPWLEFLIVWPFLLFLIPIQDVLVQLVGLRGNIFLLPFILIGARLESDERYDLALWLSALNLLAFAFACVEFFTGIERFFPQNEMTQLIYISKDVAGHTAYRIPSIFSGAHAYAGTMVMGLPLLSGALLQTDKRDSRKWLLVAGLIVALLGVFIAATRLHFIAACILMIVAVFSLRSRVAYTLGWIVLLCGIGWIVSGEQRLQRFTELKDTNMVTERIAGSINMGFFDLATTYPFGNGLGGGGTSIPYFLRDRIENPIGMENEYSRIMLEQGLLGLGFWIAFILWLLTRRDMNVSDPWFLGRRLAWVTCAAYFAAGLIGTGLFTSVPQTCLFLLNIGWVAAQQPARTMEVYRVPQRLSNYSVG